MPTHGSELAGLQAEMTWIPHLGVTNRNGTEVRGLPRFTGGWLQVIPNEHIAHEAAS